MIGISEKRAEALRKAARGTLQAGMVRALLQGEAIRPAEYGAKDWAGSTLRSFDNFRQRAAAGGVAIVEGPFGPQGGKRFRIVETTPEDVPEDQSIEWLANSEQVTVRGLIARHPAVGDETLTRLARDPSTMADAGRNPALPLRVRVELLATVEDKLLRISLSAHLPWYRPGAAFWPRERYVGMNEWTDSQWELAESLLDGGWEGTLAEFRAAVEA